MKRLFVLLSLGLGVVIAANAQNPIIHDQFTADPTARAFEGRVYLYPSHDIPAPANFSRKDWFCMEDYHVFSSDNLVTWKDHGVILSQDKVPWGNHEAYAMWAPDCIFRNGKYYFFYPATPKDFKIGSIGVAVADKPYGPFKPEATPIKGTRGIDPCSFIDKDGQAYLYWAGGNIYVAKLKDNMLELASDPKIIEGLPKGFKEGPFFFERNGFYYLTFPLVLDKTETLAYCMGKSPMGPFEYKGLIMDQSPTGCWTNHHSLVQFKGQWYLFYHHNDYSPQFDKNRSVRVDSLFFNSDGTIRKVIPTLRGVGITSAKDKIQIDRYSKIGNGTSIAFLNENNKFEGWKTVFAQKGSWLQYNRVDFGHKKLSKAYLRVKSSQGGILQIKADNDNGMEIAKAVVPAKNAWTVIQVPVIKSPKAVKNLFAVLNSGEQVEIDWLYFK